MTFCQVSLFAKFLLVSFKFLLSGFFFMHIASFGNHQVSLFAKFLLVSFKFLLSGFFFMHIALFHREQNIIKLTNLEL